MANLEPSQVQELRNLASEEAEGCTSYEIHETLGAGGSAAVFATESGGRKVALKIYDPSFFNEANGIAELRRLQLQRELIGKKCSTLAEVYQVVERQNTCFIEMEHCPWPTLKGALNLIPTSAIPRLISQLSDAARYLESLGLVHRDIKPENILVDPTFRELKLIDFGVLRSVSSDEDLSGATDHGNRRPFIATAQYSSPEYLFRLIEPSNDLWRGLTFYQIGAVLHDLLAKKPIFNEEMETGNRFKLAWAVLNKIPVLDEFRTSENKAHVSLARMCLTKDLSFRLNLVRWEDFYETKQESASLFARRLERYKAASAQSGSRTNSAKQLQLARERQGERLHALALSGMLDSFGKNLRIESVEGNKQGGFLLKLVLPGELPTMFVTVRINWNPGDESERGEVSVVVALDESTQSASRSVGETDISGANNSSLCESLVAAAANSLNEMCEIAEERIISSKAESSPDKMSKELAKNER